MNKARNRHVLLLSSALILLFTAALAYVFFKAGYAENFPILGNSRQFNPGNVYNFYINPEPDINGRVYYGSQDASVTIIAFLDIESESSEYFFNSLFPKLDEDFIKTGRVRYYPKHYITTEDIMQKNNKFLYAASLACIGIVKKEAHKQFYLDMFKPNGAKQIPELMAKYKIPKESMDKCLPESLGELQRDALETENFGFSGMSPRFYIGIDGKDSTILDGIPKYSKLNRTIIQYEFSIGG